MTLPMQRFLPRARILVHLPWPPTPAGSTAVSHRAAIMQYLDEYGRTRAPRRSEIPRDRLPQAGKEEEEDFEYVQPF